METAQPPTEQRQFPCKSCGANLVFQPGQSHLACPYCGAENVIVPKLERVEEQDFNTALADQERSADVVEALTVKCTNCGAESELKPNITAGRCPFCGAAIVTQGQATRKIRPRSLLPFFVAREQAMGAFRQWIGSLWFAPSGLMKYAEAGVITGVYLPYWTYDAQTQSAYTGERGDNYWDTEVYTTVENGQTVTRTRQVMRTRWSWVSGQVRNPFDDVLVIASHSLPPELTGRLEIWDLNNLVPYQEEYLAGFVAESYQVDLPQGFAQARQIMDGVIRQSIIRDIGGDHQRIGSVDTRYWAVTFKHVLLPLWISAYRYRQKTFRFCVNARSGQVCGERPYSWAKITLLILSILAAIALAVWLFKTYGQ